MKAFAVPEESSVAMAEVMTVVPDGIELVMSTTVGDAVVVAGVATELEEAVDVCKRMVGEAEEVWT